MNEKIPSDYYRGLPPDLWPRRVFVGRFIERGVEIERGVPGAIDRAIPPPFPGTAIYVGRGFQGRVVTVGTTPTLIQRSERAWPYMILNPSRSVGLTSYGTLVSERTVNAAGNIQSSPLGVANYLNLHLFLNVTAITGTWDIYAQAYNPVISTWADSQVIFGSITTTGDYYASIGQLGVTTDFSVRWNPTVAGSMTFSIAYVLKEGTIGSSSGVAQTVYLGSDNGVSTVSGFPILEGEHYTFILGENIELWGIAETNVTLRIFEL